MTDVFTQDLSVTWRVKDNNDNGINKCDLFGNTHSNEIALRLGEFHVKGKILGFTFFKFILQSTFVSVLKTNMSSHFMNTFTGTVPIVPNRGY